MKEFVNSFTNYLFVLKNAQNGGKYDTGIVRNCKFFCVQVSVLD